MKKLLPFMAGIAIVALSGCVGDSSSRHGNDDNHATGPVINIPAPVAPIDEQKLSDRLKDGVSGELTKLKQDVSNQITASSNTTQDQLTGLVNTSVSKLAEKMTGVEANLKDLVHVEADVRNTATVDIKNRIDSTIKAVADLKLDITAQLALNANVAATLNAVNSMSAEINTKLAAQVGIGNRIDQLEQHLSAGRDVNQLPMNTVWLMLIGCTAVFGLLLVVVMVMGRAAREREAERTAQERANVENWQKVALQAISQLEPGKAREIKLPTTTGGLKQ